jgi:heme exporter protein C
VPAWLRPALWVGLLTVLPAAALMALAYAPDEPAMHMAQRILYVHVPAAVAALVAFLVVCAASIAYLCRERLLWDHLATGAAELGVLFSAIVLATGPLWAKPIWGAYWRWEPRLTSMLILFCTYVAYLMIRRYGADSARFRRAAAVMGVAAFANIPLVYLSVRLWAADQQLHPQAVELDSGMVVTLVAAVLGFGLLLLFLLDRTVQLRLLGDQIDELRARLARGEWEDATGEGRT